MLAREKGRVIKREDGKDRGGCGVITAGTLVQRGFIVGLLSWLLLRKELDRVKKGGDMDECTQSTGKE